MSANPVDHVLPGGPLYFPAESPLGGDSDTRAGRPDDEVFPPAALADIRAAMEFVRARYGIRDITLAGPCSGAYHALRAARCAQPWPDCR